MKSFNQFLQESYLSEAGVPDDYEEYIRSGKSGTPKKMAQMSDTDFNARFGNNPRAQFARDIGKQQSRPARRRRSGGPTPEEVKAGIDKREAEQAAKKAQRTPSGAAARSDLQFKSTKVQSPTTARPALPAKGQTQRGAPLARRTSSNPGIPDAMMRGAQDAANKPSATPKPPASTPSSTTKPSSGGKSPALSPSSSTGARWKAALEKQRKAAAGSGSSGKTIITPAPAAAAKEAEKAVAKTATKTAGKGILKTLGRVAGPASAALDVADEKSKGSGWVRSLAKGAAVAAGGALGGAAGSAVAPGAGTVAGAVGGSMAASKAFDVAAGANAKERKAIATANRQSQSGGAIKGIGGKTTFDTKKNTITTGTGSQRKTAQLGKTSVVTDPKTGKQDTGYLAYKGGKAVYKKADTKSLAKTSSNPLERIGRSLFAGAYKANDAKLAAKKLATARQSDVARNKALGVKALPGK